MLIDGGLAVCKLGALNPMALKSLLGLRGESMGFAITTWKMMKRKELKRSGRDITSVLMARDITRSRRKKSQKEIMG